MYYKLGLFPAEYQILVDKDGNQYCALLGHNLQEGYCGFGDTIGEALIDLGGVLLKEDKR